MIELFKTAGHISYGLALAIYYTLCNIIKLIIPFRMRLKDVSNDIVLITGAGNGIGASLARKFSKRGATVVLLDIEESSGKRTLQEIQANKGKGFFFQCDVSNPEEIYKISDLIKREVGDVSILVNNAGIANVGTYTELSDERLEKIFQINIISHFRTVKCFLPKMIENNRGHIVTTASMLSFFGGRLGADYCATKHGLLGFIDAIRQEIRTSSAHGVKTTLICPSFINTRICNGLKLSFELLDLEKVTDRIMDGILTDEKLIIIPTAIKYSCLNYLSVLPTQAFEYLFDNVMKVEKSDNSNREEKKNL